jgi:hypothetical protein
VITCGAISRSPLVCYERAVKTVGYAVIAKDTFHDFSKSLRRGNVMSPRLSTDSAPLRSATRTRAKTCAPSSDQRICCFLATLAAHHLVNGRLGDAAADGQSLPVTRAIVDQNPGVCGFSRSDLLEWTFVLWPETERRECRRTVNSLMLLPRQPPSRFPWRGNSDRSCTQRGAPPDNRAVRSRTVAAGCFLLRFSAVT